ncbi:MAG TPA: GNAT family N-acetyltransferase [Pseudomonadales bacterium]
MSERSTNVSVRSAGSGDASLLIEFNLAMAMESEDKGLDRATLAAGVEHLIEHPLDGFYLVAELAGVPAGSLMVTYEWSDWRAGRFWWIQSVYVKPEYRRKGVYSALHRSVRERALSAPDTCGIRLYVERENAGAQATYASLGMSETAYRLYEEEF